MNIALRRLGPEDLPDSQLLFGIVLLVYVCVQAPMVWMQYDSTLIVFQTILSQLLMLAAGVWALLRLSGHPTRFRQTMVALIGVSSLLSALTIPFVVWHRAASSPNPEELSLPGIAILAIVIWSLAADGHIFSRALSRPFVAGLMIAIGFFIISSSLLREILPA